SKRAQPVQRQLSGDLWWAERKPRVESRPAGGDAVVARAAAAAPRVAERAWGDRQPGRPPTTDKGGKPMRDLQAIADRVEIEALRGEFTDAVMMRDYDRAASLFTEDCVLRMPHIAVEVAGPGGIRAWGRQVPAFVDFLVQNTHPGMIAVDGDIATGRAYMAELGRLLDGRSGLYYAIYHDRYQRTGDGWKFTERVYEVRYEDT